MLQKLDFLTYFNAAKLHMNKYFAQSTFFLTDLYYYENNT